MGVRGLTLLFFQFTLFVAVLALDGVGEVVDARDHSLDVHQGSFGSSKEQVGFGGED